jgi:transcriptional regulator with XRE-family HTH domain
VRNTPRGAAVGPAYLPSYTIQAKREALKWTKRELGEKAGLSDTFVSELERGIATGRLKHYEALRRALDLPITGQPQ